MKTMVVYDSKYGNTQQIAEVMAQAIPNGAALKHVGELNSDGLRDCALLIVGAPTHGGGPSEGAKAVLDALPADALVGVHVAAFDTRLTWWWLRPFGYAAPKIARSLEQKGSTLIADAEGFLVAGGEGPLVAGELERAAVWAAELAALRQQQADVAA